MICLTVMIDIFDMCWLLNYDDWNVIVKPCDLCIVKLLGWTNLRIRWKWYSILASFVLFIWLLVEYCVGWYLLLAFTLVIGSGPKSVWLLFFLLHQRYFEDTLGLSCYHPADYVLLLCLYFVLLEIQNIETCNYISNLLFLY